MQFQKSTIYEMLKEVYALMEKLEEICFFPDTRTYSILMEFHAQNDDIDEVLCYFKKMMGCQTVLHAFCIKYMISKVEVIVKDMNALGIHVDEDSQSTTIRMYINIRMLKKACAWFQRFYLARKVSCECYVANIDAYGE
jgi:pentatricopeptide repeat protein